MVNTRATHSIVNVYNINLESNFLLLDDPGFNTVYTLSWFPFSITYVAPVTVVLMDCEIERFATFHAGYQINTVSLTGNWLLCDGMGLAIHIGSLTENTE